MSSNNQDSKIIKTQTFQVLQFQFSIVFNTNRCQSYIPLISKLHIQTHFNPSPAIFDFISKFHGVSFHGEYIHIVVCQFIKSYLVFNVFVHSLIENIKLTTLVYCLFKLMIGTSCELNTKVCGSLH